MAESLKVLPYGMSEAGMADFAVARRATAQWIVANAEQNAPELFAKFYPRQYDNVGGYTSPKLIAAALLTAALETRTLTYDGSPTAYKLLIPSLKPLVERRVPLMFLDPGLLEAVKQTQFDGDIDWATLPLPYEEGIFVLPKGGLVHPTDGECAFIVYARIQPGRHLPPIPGIQTVNIENMGFVLEGFCPATATWLDSVLNAQKRHVLRLDNIYCREMNEAIPRLEISSPLEEELDAADEAFLQQMGVVTFGTLLALTARPGLLEKEQRQRVIPAKRDRPQREFWSPNIIGRLYRPKREALGGTYASPRMHWRRGHFRRQVCGTGRKERKTIWLEPMLVAAQVEGKNEERTA